MIDKKGKLWQYISPGQKNLIEQGLFLLADTKFHVPVNRISDFSYIVFPFAKAYEGFLKQLFLDCGFISQQQYQSDFFRIGKVLSPNLQRRLGKRSVYRQLVQKIGNDKLANQLWMVWKNGRNQLFHYFPHNLHSIDRHEAEVLISNILQAMVAALILFE